MKKQNPSYLEIVQQYYGASTLYFDEFGQAVVEYMRYKGYEPDQVMLANSICSDDVNAMQFPPALAKFLGPFNMGGLDGFPFTGITGVSAFSHHAPDDGVLMIFFAPHIGISRKGYPEKAVGKIQRKGQTDLSSACGAVRGALDKVLGSTTRPRPVGPLDSQQDLIVDILWDNKSRITNSKKDPMIEATQIMYENIYERLLLLIKESKVHHEIIIIGGIYINVDADYKKPFFSFARNSYFEVHNKKNKKKEFKKKESFASGLFRKIQNLAKERKLK